MPHIRQLEPHVADLIAAGEVVERPASVVKELVENAIDAGAGAVTVEIQNGGMTLIRVTDNGCGIPDGETETAFLRHATSKLRREEDLEAIGTLGFRGEALAAIAAVSRVELLTRAGGAVLGTALSLEGGVVVSHQEAGCGVGTTILVRDLFFNTPARLKFMKKDAAEGAAVFAAVQRLALSHPEVSFKFIRDGKQELLTPGDGVLKSAVYAVLGRDLALGFLPVKGSGEDIGVSGFASLPTCCRGTRGYQHFFVNGRYVKSRTMTAALEEAYKNQKMVGKFPGCVLHLTTKLNAVDVNVHPTKQEVKFTNERRVFDAVYYAVLSALGGDQSRPQAAEALHPVVDQGRQTSLPLHDFTTPQKREQSPPADRGKVPPKGTDKGAYRRGTAPQGPTLISQPPADSFPLEGGSLRATGSVFFKEESLPPKGGKASPAKPVTDERAMSKGTAPQEPTPVLEEPQQEIPWRVAGEVLRTYIIVEQGDRVLLIDKHAAHERMNFDRLKAQDYRPIVQELLTPLVLKPAAEEAAALLERPELLEEFGFRVEDFGGGALLVRSAPGDIEAGNIAATLSEIAGKLLTTGRADPAAARDELLHTMACKAAIKGGQKSGLQELERVAAAVVSGEVKYCPHGRPVAIELTRAQLEKQFKRT